VRRCAVNDAVRIGVAGAGAIGCTLAARLRLAEMDVSLLARGRTLATLQAQGIHLVDLEGEHRVAVNATAVAEGGPRDVVFLCSKSQDLPALAAQVQPWIGAETLIVPLVNGVPFWFFHRQGGRFDGQAVHAVDPQGELARLLPPDQVIGAVTFITAETLSAGDVVSRTPHLLMLGELDAQPGITDRLQRLCAVIGGAGVEARPMEQIRDKLWTKLIANLTSNPLSVVSGATLGEIYSRDDLLANVREVMNEVMLVSACYGARLQFDPIEFVRLGAEMGEVRTSMLQDHLRGRPLELAAIGDAVVELADRYDLPMTATRALLARTREVAQTARAA